MRLSNILLCLLATAVQAAPAAGPLGVNLGVKFDKRQDELPTLTLPYGTWRASDYNADADVYTFKNIRFAAPAGGENRWRKPQPPANNDTIQDGSYGPICVQAPIEGLNLLGPGNNAPIGGAINQFLGGIPVPIFEGGSEDCLFLDLFVPGDAVRDPNSQSLPVIVWIYGGAYVFGSKDALDLIGFYSGTGLIQQTGGKVIYVAAVFQWVQDYISLVGGDKTNVNAWGESAGAGSILHHLTAQGNYWDVESLIISHTSDESELFVDGHIQTDEQFNEFIDSVFPNYTKEAGINAAIEEFYPPVSTNDTYDTIVERTKAFVRDSSFTCWSRFLTDTYAGKTWNMQYSVTPGWHGTDLLPTFYQIYLSFGGDVAFPLLPGFGTFATAYQSYLTSHARSGNPNTYSAKINIPPAITWPRPTTGGENVGNVLNVGDLGFSLTTDDQFPKSECDFILELAAAVTNVGGYAVPGTAQPQSLVEFGGDPSANYE
ncbi:putative carboxylesterase family protein [Neofusicoccum parvum UCRNP2]|uniref:Putative carboxylesterase family protein n=1 Tax=Botryosphaeria parva (strain UCR-NP2) TaxID=1287680 RepID=R1G9C5_BOTPV|nr:putative carboxylesterase family protein [Neofusicoccum parvum UCRNP2]